MQPKSLIAAVLAAAFAFPLAATAGGDKTSKDKTASTQSGATNGAAADGGADAMFKAMDKNSDGIVTREEAMGTPHHAQFAQLDKDGDGKLSREEHAAAPEHARGASSAGTAGSDTGSSGKKPY